MVVIATVKSELGDDVFPFDGRWMERKDELDWPGAIKAECAEDIPLDLSLKDANRTSDDGILLQTSGIKRKADEDSAIARKAFKKTLLQRYGWSTRLSDMDIIHFKNPTQSIVIQTRPNP